MSYELISLVSRLRDVKTLDDLESVKTYGESLMRKQKNEALLILMTVAEELGDDEVLKSLDDMKKYLRMILKK